jgi:hypothetical protein
MKLIKHAAKLNETMRMSQKPPCVIARPEPMHGEKGKDEVLLCANNMFNEILCIGSAALRLPVGQ